jgi:hypothetical protein
MSADVIVVEYVKAFRAHRRSTGTPIVAKHIACHHGSIIATATATVICGLALNSSCVAKISPGTAAGSGALLGCLEPRL